MRTIAASEVKQRFGACIEAAQAEPVLIERSGRPSVVILSVAEYDRLMAIEDAQWGAMAQKAIEGGFTSAEETSAWFKRMEGKLHAKS